MASRLLGVSEPVIQQMAASVYTRDLLYGRLKEALGGDLPSVLTVAQRYLLTQNAEQFNLLSFRLGCVCYARTILSVITGEALRKLAYLTTSYVIHDAAWGIEFSAASGLPLSPEQLADAIHVSGISSLWAWCEAQPVAVGRRVQTALPVTEENVRIPLVHPERMVDAFVTKRLCDD
nr:hypothetical protein [uncultured Acetobacter sp.]